MKIFLKYIFSNFRTTIQWIFENLQPSQAEKPQEKVLGNEANINLEKNHDYKVNDSVLELFSKHAANPDKQLHDRYIGRERKGMYNPL